MQCNVVSSCICAVSLKIGVSGQCRTWPAQTPDHSVLTGNDSSCNHTLTPHTGTAHGGAGQDILKHIRCVYVCERECVCLNRWIVIDYEV